MIPFPSEKLKRILYDLEKQRPKGRAVAAFDADGTLWNTDLGETLFAHQIRHRLVPLPPDPWAHYNHLKTISHPVAYLWLAQINKGVPVVQLREWAEAAVAEVNLPLFDAQVAIVEKLKSLEVEIYIVTASIRWAVEPGARRLGLSEDQVIGIETFIENGLVTDTQKGVITYREGKPEALLKVTDGTKPYFSSGNTEGDRWLLESATQLRLVISAAPQDSENWPTENRMLTLAAEKNWYSHRY